MAGGSRVRRIRHAAILAVSIWTFASLAPWAGADVPSAFQKADDAYARGQLAAAREQYADALKQSPRDLRALSGLVRAESELGEDASGEARNRLFAAAVEHARAAVAAAPDSASAHAWLAVALGRQAVHEGPRSRLAMAREIKSEADRALELDPRQASAYHVRGVWNRDIASLNFIERATARAMLGSVPRGATLENEVADLEKATAIAPDMVINHLELGRTYHIAHRDDDARRELEKAASMPPTSSARDAKLQIEAHQLLTKLKRPK
jgi:tetratricopeptide (TPR) repeat protein